MKIAAIITVALYAIALLFIFSYSLAQMNLVYNYLRFKRKTRGQAGTVAPPVDRLWPAVTVQLPVYNELYVVERLIDSVSELDYPADKLEIQVLDDSTDETVELIAAKTASVQQRGINITHIRRGNRTGYKAGALAYGLSIAEGDLVVIFDSDFLPERDFLKRTVPAFDHPDVGAVQTRWEHLNRDYSLLTQLQAFGLDAHFSIEQKGRNVANHFINFNGTAGVWRKSCIEQSGGWQSDTLTEDLDLSYRAQLKGWRFEFLEEVAAPAELPVTMNALKNQQFRWNKGAAECVKKNLGSVLRKKELRWKTKMHAIFHLMNSSVFIAIMITAILSVPILWIKQEFIEFKWLFLYASLFLVSFLILGVFYYAAYVQREKSFPANLFRFLKRFPLFLSISMGLALHNAIAVMEGYLGKKSSFVRTPKFNIRSATQTWKGNKYLKSSVNAITIMEGLLAAYFICGMLLAFRLGDFGLFPFHVMLAAGFGMVCFYSVFHSKGVRRAAHESA